MRRYLYITGEVRHSPYEPRPDKCPVFGRGCGVRDFFGGNETGGLHPGREKTWEC